MIWMPLISWIIGTSESHQAGRRENYHIPCPARRLPKEVVAQEKFVVGCDYCITLDRIPRTLYSEIIANDAQRQEWVRLFAIDEIKGDMMTEGYSEPLTEKFLEDNPFLVLDTKFFSAEFKHKLVGSMEKVDEECNGLLINSENFQALELLREKYREAVNACTLIRHIIQEIMILSIRIVLWDLLG